jgi:hypothetical protein
MEDTMAETTITHEDIGDDLRRIVISGRLDTPGDGRSVPTAP